MADQKQTADNDKIVPVFVSKWKKIKKELGKKDVQKAISTVLDRCLSSTIRNTTFWDINKEWETKKLSSSLIQFLTNILIVHEDFIQLLGKEGMDVSFVESLHKEFGRRFKECHDWYKTPNRWRTVSTDIIQSEGKGMLLVSSLYKYNFEVCTFEGCPEDWVLLINHLITSFAKLPEEIRKANRPQIKQIIQELKKI